MMQCFLFFLTLLWELSLLSLTKARIQFSHSSIFLHICLSRPLQDLKPSNLAVNEDCELKVGVPLSSAQRQVETQSVWILSFSLSVSLCFSPSPLLLFSPDLGLWPGAAHRRRDDRLRGHSLVPSPGDHVELDALQHDRSEGILHGCFKRNKKTNNFFCTYWRWPLWLKIVCCPFLFSVQWTSGQWGASWQNSSLEGPCFPARTVSFAIFQRAAQSCRGCLDAVSFTNQTG